MVIQNSLILSLESYRFRVIYKLGAKGTLYAPKVTRVEMPISNYRTLYSVI